MATLSEITKKLSEQTEANAQATRELNKSNISLRSDVVKLTGSVDKYATREKRVQFLENVLDTNSTGLADTFKETLMGPLTSLADAIPGKQFLMPLFKMAAQKTPLKGFLERRRDQERDKIATGKAEMAIQASGMQFDNEEEKKAAIERVKLEMAKKEQEEQIKEKNKQIADLLGIEIDKFQEVIGKTEKVQENVNQLAESTPESIPESTEESKPEKIQADPYTGGSATPTNNSAAMVENQREQEVAMERRHAELIDAIKGGSGGGGGDASINEGDGSLKGVGGVLQSIGKGFKYLGKNLKDIAKGALAIGLMGVSLVPFALAAMKFNDVEWESMAKAGVALVGLAGVAFLLGKASGSMIIGAGAILVLSGALWVAGKAFQQFAELDWMTVGLGLAAILGLGAVAAILSFASPLIIAGSFAIGALGIALIPFAYAASLAAPALTEIAQAMGLFADVPISTMFAIPAALAAIGLGLVAMSGGGLVGSIADGIGGLFGADSPIEKLVKIAESAPQIIALGSAMETFGDKVDKMMDGLDRIDPSKFEGLRQLGDAAEDFVDKMPGLIGQAKLAAFAMSFASIAASAGVAPAVAQGVADVTGEVVAVQESPSAYVAKKAPSGGDGDAAQAHNIEIKDPDNEVPASMTEGQEGESGDTQKVKYKGKVIEVAKEDVEKIKDIDAKLALLAEDQKMLQEDWNKLSSVQRRTSKGNRIKGEGRANMRMQEELLYERQKTIATAAGDEEALKALKSPEEAKAEARAKMGDPDISPMTGSMVEKASNENASVNREAGMGGVVAPTIINAPNNSTNVSGGGGGGSVMPVPISEPDYKTRSMLLNSF